MEESNQAKAIVNRYQKLKSDRAVRDTLWDEIASYMQFRKSNILSKVSTPEELTVNVQDMTAVQANLTMAAGQLSYIAPVDSIWFVFEDDEKDETKAKFYRNASQKAREKLVESNFYLEFHESLLDRGAFAISCLYVDFEDDKLIFRNIPIGSYVVAEDKNGFVDTVIREFELTIKNAIAKFGEENLPPALIKDRTMDDKISFIHCVKPNKKYDPEKATPEFKKFSSYYVSIGESKIIQEGGYDEMPYIVSRFNSYDADPYGYGPGIQALPVIKQIQRIEEDIDIIAEKLARPPILAPSTQAFEIESQAAGVTLFDASNPDAIPREWQTEGRYDVAVDRAEKKREMIDAMFFVPLFQMFGSLEDRQRTATEIVARESEKLITFSPTFSRLVAEFLNPMLERVFGLLLRQGEFGEIPAELRGADFRITYMSKISLALKNLQTQSFFQFLEASALIAQIDPSVVDNLDTDEAFRQSAATFNVPEKFLRDKEDIEKIREDRAQQQQQMQAVEQAAQLGKVAPELMEMQDNFQQ